MKMIGIDFNAAFLLSILLSVCLGEKVWMFATSGNRRPSDFIDTDGFVKGASLDLIKEVCKIAGKKCEITVQPFEECYRTVRNRIYPGIGIMSGWYDACVGYVSLPERLNSVAFTVPFAQSSATFTVLMGNPRNFDPNNVSISTITHINGLYTSAPCLTRLNKMPKSIIIAADLDETKALLLNGTADAIFSPRTNIPGLEVLPDRFDCSVSGTGMMVRKDSDLPSWWNPAFNTFYRSGKYQDWCLTRHTKYGGPDMDPNYCLPPPSASGSATTTPSGR